MERALIRLVFATLLLSCNASYIRAQESREDIGPRDALAPYRSQEAAVPASLQDLYRRLAEYWEDENSRAIAHLVAPDGRVHVVVQQEGVGERLAAPQLQYLLQEMFDSTEEVTFRFPAYSTYDPTSGAGYAVGQRVYRDGNGFEPLVERVFVGARSDRGRWIVTELRLTLD
ncbi:MAG TPA: hypothetical protein VFM44_05515 [Gemmatimonadota bacterium]|nr:hypothetical protein [Gemmatimonadota bacterium]